MSHSNNLHLLTSETGGGLTLTVGDAGPFASDHRLSVWESSEDTVSMALLDLTGNVVKEAVVVNAPYHRYSPVTALTNGTVLWAFADHGDTSVRLVLVKP